jgi:uncharacterized membrane protein YhaH (DUF805 family)
MECAKCERENAGTANFCSGCGTALNPPEAGGAGLGSAELPMMPFQTSVETCFRRYVDFKGRSTRAEYWWFSLFTMVGTFITAIADLVASGNPFGTTGLIEGLFHLSTLLPSLAVGARRLHDINRSAWWLLLYLTIVGIILLIIWAIQQGDKGDNEYGSDPRQAPLA